jgi:hypothetical protein
MEFNKRFEYDLKLGELGEKLLGEILTNKKIEVKTDYGTRRTGNIFIEYMSRDKPSGISKTEADFYCFVISNERLILVETEKLKEICRPYIGSALDTVGGDNKSSRGILLPVNELVYGK